MPIKTLFILISLLSILTAIIANEDTLIIEAEDKAIEKILKAEVSIGVESEKSLDKEKLSSVLCVITNFILAEEVNEKSDFSELLVLEAGPVRRYLSGKVTDKQGVEKLVASFDDATPNREYEGGIVTEIALHLPGTTVVLTTTDNTGDVTTETRVM